MSAPPITGSPLLEAAAPRLDEHLRRSGPLPWRGAPGRLIEDVRAAGLTGRGGAGFPVARKLAAVLAAGAPGVVVGNGAEGEPASAKDRYLLGSAPHLVLDGLQLAAEAVGASAAHIVVPADAVPAIDRALAERAALDRLPVGVHVAADHFLAGEESALVAALDGRAPLPEDKFVRPGVGGRPTAVQNVETLAHLALIARYGPARFRAAGTPSEPGTMLVTVSGGVARPGVLEVPLGTPLPDVLAAAGPQHAGPVLVGGFHGAWLGADEVARVRLCAADLRDYGAAPGAGVLVVLPPGASGLVESARIVGYLAGQSAGRCGPCRNGLPRLAGLLARLAAGERDPRLAAEAHAQADLVAGRGACHHPDGTVPAGPQRPAGVPIRDPRKEPAMTPDAVLHVDWTRCRGRGLCAELLPELIGRDADGYPLTRTDVAVPGPLIGPARTAVRDCPRLALRLAELTQER